MQNFRLALRALTKQPLFTGIVIVTFALGIGANSAIFSVLNAVVLRPLAFHQPQRLVELELYDTRLGPQSGSSVSYPDFRDWRAQNSVFERVAVYTNQNLTLADGKQTIHVQGEAVSGELFDLLGAVPILGRNFTPREDEPGNRSAILSYALWQRQFGGDSAVIGKPVLLDGKSYHGLSAAFCFSTSSYVAPPNRRRRRELCVRP